MLRVRLLLLPLLVVAGAVLATAEPAGAKTVPMQPPFRVLVFDSLTQSQFHYLAKKGAVGLLVPGVGPKTNRRQALAEMLRGAEVNARLGGVPSGPRLITAAAATGYPSGCCYIVVVLPPKGRPAPNDLRYPIVVLGRGFHGLLVSRTTRIPGLVSIVDIAPTALGRERGTLGSQPSAESRRGAREPQPSDPREQPAEVRGAARRRRLRALLPAAPRRAPRSRRFRRRC